MDFRKTHFRAAVPQMPEVFLTEERKTSPHPNGGLDLDFFQVDTKEIDRTILDPREITLQSMIESNCFIQPTDVQHIFNITDKSDIESLAGRITEDQYEYIVAHESNFDYDKNTIVEPKTEES